MSSGSLDRVAIIVDDLDAVAADLESVFGMTMTVIDVPSLGIRVGLGNDGFELVEQTGRSDLERLWRRPLAALVVRVPDVDEATARMAELGVVVDHEVDTPGGLKEVSFGTNFHGLPLVVCDGDGDVVHGVGAEGGGEFSPTVNRLA